MKLTDEMVAKALGWKPTPWDKPYGKNMKIGKKPLRGQDAWHWVNGSQTNWSKTPPAFTTSLDAIVAEIEARKPASWLVEYDCVEGKYYAEIESIQTSLLRCHAVASFATEKTAPLALCAALLEYLKEATP